ncbi:hypothetical protein BASA50_008408 [Batrachochytrium salamandrivorans]|uniref:Uncharacterized protein n=1 Tax=Batrachochytrium salamandrivorans TaxID=1357716 RepID=A0ABQ8F4N0_9FUNG|nr:hypothetical protein BASA50_008408 [Batrachochytrium salamandrivorans]
MQSISLTFDHGVYFSANWSISQDIEPTKRESADDSNMNGTGNNLICSLLISIAKGLHENVFEHVDEFQSHMPLFHILQDKAEHLKDEDRDDHSASFGRVNGRLQDIEERFTSLKDRYLEIVQKWMQNECMTESVHLITPSDMERIDIPLDELLNLPGNAEVHEKDVIFLDRQ